jgi:hypothetical protein
VRAAQPDVLATALNAWLTAYLGTLPRALALDGKSVRDLVLTLAFSEHVKECGVACLRTIQKPPRGSGSL